MNSLLFYLKLPVKNIIGIDDEIAQCLEDYFDISKEYWLNMQKKYDYDNQKQIYTTMSDTTCT